MLTLFGEEPEPKARRAQRFAGVTYDERRDGSRLEKQLVRVRSLMLDGRWRTLAEIARATGDPEASASARLRDLRKAPHGGWTVERRRRTTGLFEYRIADAKGARA